MKLTYDFKVLQELEWVAATAAAGVIGAELITLNQSILDNPLAWGTALLVAAGRAGMAAIIAKLSADGTFSAK